jgi:hypothetical protein
MKPLTLLATLAAVPALGGCMLQYALFGFPAPQVTAPRPVVEMAYREGPGGLVLLKGRVDGKADVDFILDTGAPVTVLIDGARTAGLGLDTSKAAPLGDPKDPASPVGVIQDGFALDFGDIALRKLTAVVVPQKTLPCPDRFEAVGFGGVVGADLFRRFVVEVDTRAKKVRFHDPASWKLPAGAASAPITFRGGHPYLHLPLRLASGKQVEAEMHFDIGMNRGLALNAGSHPDLVFPAEGKVLKKCLVNGMREDRQGPRATLAIGGRELADEGPSIAPPGQAIADQKHGSFGIGLLRERRFVFDYPGKRLVLLD